MNLSGKDIFPDKMDKYSKEGCAIVAQPFILNVL